MSSTAAALLLTTMAASAPVTAASRLSMWLCREPRQPFSTSYSSVEYLRATCSTASAACRDRQERPRFVCSTTPVPLMTGRREGSRSAAARTYAASRIASRSGRSVSAPERMRERSASSSPRTASRIAAGGMVSVMASSLPRSSASASNSSTLGILRRISCCSMPSRSLIVFLPSIAQVFPNVQGLI